MERRPVLYLQGKKRGELVAPDAFQRKLLSYEWSIIQALGVTEQEYREIFQRIAEEQRERSAEYAHIPEIAAGPAVVPVLINLAVGLVLTGVSMLLAPKPQSQDRDDREQRSILGSNQEGRTRFANTIGFDGVPQLAQLGSRIPLVFGDYRPANGDIEASGGIVVEPLLVWSQVISKGTYQNFKGQYVICERGLDFRPSKQSYMMGGQPIDDIYEVNYELFFSSKNQENILTADDSQYGLAAPGDDQIFTVPNAGTKTKGFCSSYSPTNKSIFGVSAPIRNGGRWSLNWRVINLFQNEMGKDDEGHRLKNQRRKIAGEGGDSRDEGMTGTGRWYSPQMGIEAISRGNASNWQYPPSENAWEVEANLGDFLKFRITPRNYIFPEDLNADMGGNDNPVDEKANNYDDINSALNSLRAAADDAMQRGEIFCCNQTLLQVADRSGTFEPARENEDKQEGRVYVILKVIGFTGLDHTVGIASQNVFKHYGVMREGPNRSRNIPGRKEANWFSLVKYDMAQAVNTRACQVTEIGIKSQVWTRINGLCNFSDVPLPKDLEKYDEDNISVSNGSVNKYTFRTSFFKIGIRAVDEDRYQDRIVDGFAILDDVLFAVRGDTPTDQFNFIRFIPTGPEAKKYEYRIIPVTATQVYRNLSQKPRAFVLGVTHPLHTQTLSVPDSSDRFSVQFYAKEEPLGIGVPGFDPVLDLEELHQAPGGMPGDQVEQRTTVYDDPDPDSFRTSNFDGRDRDQFAFDQAALETIFGPLKESNDRSYDRLDYGTEGRESQNWKVGDKTVKMSLRAVVSKNRDDNASEKYGTKRMWKLTQADFQDPDDKKRLGSQGTKLKIEDFEIDRDAWYWSGYLHDANDRGQSRECDLNLKATGSERKETITLSLIDSDFREWDNYAQIKEISPYDEVSHSSDQGPEHELMYVNESDGVQTEYLDDFTYNNMSMLGVKFKSMAQTQQLQAMQIWLEKGISVKKLNGSDGASDLLPDIVYFLLTEPGRGMRNQIPEEMIDRPSFENTNRFLETNRLFYNGAITDQVNIRAYINQIAPFFLCHLSIKAGKFYMTPAIPTDNAGKISTQPVPLAGYFNDGNIVNGSFKLNVLDASERREFRCVMKYRDSIKNAMPQYKTIQMKYKDLTIIPDQQDFDVTQFVTTAEHAKMAARYLLASRRRVDHTIEFATSPFGIALAPGDYIKVETVSSPLETRISGRIGNDLQVIGNVANGTHTATIYRQAADSVVTEEIVIADGRVTDETLRNSLFAIPLLERRLGVYMIEELSLDEEGMVQVKASHHPVNDSGVSRIALDLLARGNDDRFTLVD